MVCSCSKSIKFNIFIYCHVYEGMPLAPTGMKFRHEILETLNYHMVKTRSLCLTWFWIDTGS